VRLLLRDINQLAGESTLRILVADGFNFAVPVYQSNRFARHAETDRHFRAKRPEAKIAAERVEYVSVLLVTAVKAHLFAHQATADADQKLFPIFAGILVHVLVQA